MLEDPLPAHAQRVAALQLLAREQVDPQLAHSHDGGGGRAASQCLWQAVAGNKYEPRDQPQPKIIRATVYRTLLH